jgi:hypothetical protein
MKTYKLNGLEYYIVAFSKQDAISIFWLHKIGVTENNLVEIDTPPNRVAIGRIFKSLDGLKSYEVEI